MSHTKERQEKICLNCNAELHGRYCHQCGQENIEPKDTVWSFITHFFYDITHFDGKFFYTVGRLFRKPGFLSKEYITGKRARYLHPIRMYIFSSAIFFLFFFSLFDSIGLSPSGSSKKANTDSAIAAARQEMLKDAKTREDSLNIENSFSQFAKFDTVFTGKKDSTKPRKKKVGYSFNASKFPSRRYYDSVQQTLQESERDNWLGRKLSYKGIELTNKYRDDDAGLSKEIFERFVHTFPYMLFVSLPLYALFLKLLYIRRKFYYVDHGLFLIHLYVFTFLLMLAVFGVSKLMNTLDWDWLGWLIAALLLYGVYYAFRAMKNFYGQGGGKTFLKFILFNFLTFVSLFLLFTIFFVFTVFRV